MRPLDRPVPDGLDHPAALIQATVAGGGTRPPGGPGNGKTASRYRGLDKLFPGSDYAGGGDALLIAKDHDGQSVLLGEICALARGRESPLRAHPVIPPTNRRVRCRWGRLIVMNCDESES